MKRLSINYVLIDGVYFVKSPSCDNCDLVTHGEDLKICRYLNCDQLKNKSCLEFVWKKAKIQDPLFYDGMT